MRVHAGAARPAIALIATALLAAMVYLLAVRAPMEDAPEEPCPAGARGCPPAQALPATEQALALRFAPVVYLREQAFECDRGGGAFDPVPVEIVLGNPEVVLRRAADPAFALRAPTAADLYGAPPDAFLDFPGNPLRPGCLYEQDARRFAQGHPPVVYARVARQRGVDALALQYWFFYYFNDWNNKHEGDWEMIQLAFEAGSLEEAMRRGPDRIAYSQHGGGELSRWTGGQLQREGERPAVFVAAGSQANFFGPHIYIGRAEKGAGLGCDDASPPHRLLSPEVRLLPQRLSGPEDPFAWTAFAGRWGELAGPEFDGPVGPNLKWAWDEPFAWEETLRNSSVRAPSRAVFGPDAVDAFCTLVAVTTDALLPLILELPLIAAAAGLAAIAAVLFSLTRTGYLPVYARPLRGRRRIGQVLLSALEVYRRRARLFLSLGLVFVPAGLLLSALHWLLLRLSPVGAAVPFPQANIGQEIVLVFALAELYFGLAYALVVAASTAALSFLERDRDAGIAEALREIRARLLHLLIARLGAMVVIGALAFSIIGLPLALRQAVRWTFLEQAVLLDGKSARAAFAESSATVGADTWWCAAAVVVLGAIGMFGAPALGIVLLLVLRSTPLMLINVVTAAVYVALVPYVAIALAMVYFDLQSRRAGAVEQAPFGLNGVPTASRAPAS